MLNYTVYSFILLNEKNGLITFNFNSVKIVIQPITQYNIRKVTVDTRNQLIHPLPQQP